MNRRAFSQLVGAASFALLPDAAQAEEKKEPVAEAPPEPVNVEDFKLLAKAKLPKATFDYITTGSGDEVTMRENVAALQRLHVLPPLLVGVGTAVQHATLTTAAQADAWFIRVAVAGGVATALAGLGDHLLLTRTLTGARREHAATNEELMS